MKKFVRVFLVAVVVALLGFDAYLMLNDTPGDTLSEVMTEAAQKWWAVAFCCSMLIPHWFFPRAKPIFGVRGAYMAAGSCVVACLANAVTIWLYGPLPWAMPIASFAGIGWGWANWSETYDDYQP